MLAVTEARNLRKKTMQIENEIKDIFIHDSILESVLEASATDQVCFYILWPKNWEDNIFSKAVIIFEGVLNYEVHEGPFTGCPTILSMQEGDEVEIHGAFRRSLRLETTAGFRTLLFTSFRFEEIGRAEVDIH